MNERLHKVMAAAGVGSRRYNERLIRAGRVRVNGRVVAELGTKVDPAADRISVDHRPIDQPQKLTYYALHKPRRYLSTVKDDRGRKTIFHLLPNLTERVYPVGRLDYDSEGLLILTNDGDLAHRLMHPRYRIRKNYLVEVAGSISDQAVKQLREGVSLEDGMTRSAFVQVLMEDTQRTLLKVGITEGRNRQIRRMCQAVNLKVVRLMRIQVGPLKLGDLPPGESRRLTAEEVQKLKLAVKRQ